MGSGIGPALTWRHRGKRGELPVWGEGNGKQKKDDPQSLRWISLAPPLLAVELGKDCLTIALGKKKREDRYTSTTNLA